MLCRGGHDAAWRSATIWSGYDAGASNIIVSPKSAKKFTPRSPPRRMAARSNESSRGGIFPPPQKNSRANPDDRETVILCRPPILLTRSGQCTTIHPADRKNHSRRGGALGSREKRVDPAVVNRQIGRILQQNQRIRRPIRDHSGAGGTAPQVSPWRHLPRRLRHWPAIWRAPTFAFEYHDLRDHSSGKPIPTHRGREGPPSASREDQLNLARSGTSVPNAVQLISCPAFLAFVLLKSSRCGQAALVSAVFIPQQRSQELKRRHSSNECPVLPNRHPGHIRLRGRPQPDAAQPALLDPPRHRLAARVRPRRTRGAGHRPPAPDRQLDQNCIADFSLILIA